MAENYTTFDWTFTASFGNGKPTSDEPEAVETTIEILEGADQFGAWQNSAPNRIGQFQEFSERGRQNYADPALYVWSPVDADLQAFDAEYSHIDATRTVEIQVWTLDNTETAQYHQDVIDFLAQYGNDNEENTTFHRIRPTSADDLRSEKVARQTDHYVASIQVELRNFRNV